MLKHYGSTRSSAAYRTRIALGLKGLDVEQIRLDLGGGDQYSEEYDALNPQHIVPTLVDDDAVVAQSLAVIEYLDEVYPDIPLLPADPAGRARVRGLSLLVACEMHPVLTNRVRGYLETKLNVSEEDRQTWYDEWTARSFEALETRLANDAATGRFCHGEAPSMADCCLIPQIFNTRLNNSDATSYPTIVRIEAACMELPAFQAARPENQPDYQG
ncbi:MAG: maleylacetoacetate isomerase [Alphaproteobacteria bacterium]|jgi:maleylacetoacetate isomerase|nr:maleylacetoacetate isomerase [Alphaproteobacteria bacterium]